MEEGYSPADLARLLGVTPAQLKVLVRAALPGGDRDRYSFQDLVLLRTAKRLTASSIPSARIREALSRLRAQLPRSRPLTGVAITADGTRLVARDGDTRWQPDSGQVLLDLGEGPPPGTAVAGGGVGPGAPGPVELEDLDGPDGGELEADDWYQLGCDLEDLEPRRAAGAYRRALAADPEHADAHVNLGRLLQEAGDPAGAEGHYRAALRIRPADATAAYNLGTALEDQRRWEDAIAAYTESIARDPGCADAHYNLARLYERTGEKVAALRHLKTARQITRR